MTTTTPATTARATTTPVQVPPGPSATTVPPTGMHVITLGTAAGPAVRGRRSGISTAVVVDGELYIIDCGLGMVRQAARAGLTMDRLRAIFVTHLHSDHVSELPGLLLYSWGPAVKGFTEPFVIAGPGPAPLPEGSTVHVAPATGGTSQLVSHVLSGYAYDINIRINDEARPSLPDLVVARDVELPPTVSADPDVDLCPDMEPFEVYADDHVRVLATLVDHPPVFPAFAYRIDSAHGSVVVSGDTKEHDNVVRLAQGADVLVHEAIDIAPYLRRGLPEAYLHHLTRSHTDLRGAARVAAAAGVGQLVLSHLAGIEDDADGAPAREVFPNTVVAEDGQVFSLARRT